MGSSAGAASAKHRSAARASRTFACGGIEHSAEKGRRKRRCRNARNQQRGTRARHRTRRSRRRKSRGKSRGSTRRRWSKKFSRAYVWNDWSLRNRTPFSSTARWEPPATRWRCWKRIRLVASSPLTATPLRWRSRKRGSKQQESRSELLWCKAIFATQRNCCNRNFENLKVGTDGRPITQIDGALVDRGNVVVSGDVAGAEVFSFRSDAPLDMRYDRDGETSAFDLVNYLSSSDLEDLLFQSSPMRGGRVASQKPSQNIVRSHLIHSTSELTSLIEAAIPVGVRRQSRVHPATQTFAALRLAVNDEFWALDHGAWALSQVLANTARLVFLTYSSHEDRTVKRTFSPPCRFADSRNGIGRPKKEPRVLPERA